MPKSYIIVAALKAETPNLEQFAPIIHTGVGKLNAAIKLYKAIQEYQPELVINYGTAGSISGVHGLLKIETFVQRDMDVQALNFPKGVTPFSGEVLPEKKGVVLGTGDNFITNAKEQLKGLEIEIDLVDMEGYALKKVADFLKCHWNAISMSATTPTKKQPRTGQNSPRRSKILSCFIGKKIWKIQPFR